MCVRGVWRVLLCLLLVLAAVLLPTLFVQRGRVPLERRRFARYLTAKSRKSHRKCSSCDMWCLLCRFEKTFIIRCMMTRVPDLGKMRLSSVM